MRDNYQSLKKPYAYALYGSYAVWLCYVTHTALASFLSPALP